MLRKSELKGRDVSSPSLPLSGWHWVIAVIHVGPQGWKPHAGGDKTKQVSGSLAFCNAKSPHHLGL